MRWVRPLIRFALLPTVVGCASPAAEERAIGRTEAIIDGEASDAAQDGVVLLRAFDDDGLELVCTGTLVGPNLVLTARHCVSYLNPGQFSCSVRGEPIDNPTGGGDLGLHLPAERIEIYAGKAPRKTALARGAQVISTLSPTICKNDVAFVVLDALVDLPVVPMRIGRPAQLHEPSILVGYGLTAEQTGIDYMKQARFQKRGLEIEALGPDSLADGVIDVAPRALILRGPSGCIGDSGGPLLAESTGAVLGVYSLQEGSSCEAPNVRHQMVHVPPFVTLIDEAFTAAGCVPTLEPEAEPGSAGAGGGASTGIGDGSDAAAGIAGGDSSVDGGASGNGNAAGARPGPPSTDLDSSGCGVAATRGSSRDDSRRSSALSRLDGRALAWWVGWIAVRGRRRRRVVA